MFYFTRCIVLVTYKHLKYRCTKDATLQSVCAKWFYYSIIQNIWKEWNSCYVWLMALSY